ncbi:chorismate synthase [Streptomyces sp. ISL-100]|uniref:chorismate synthase n=1 Tax=Streptomyces sp. ISL-100 TaxID=2819173 RepID=UPI001BE53BDF|nr:chorismate synthase [Streptomyces sp. ISL-100]MBT2394981.1 chorismate synthase [Streptomyces sp. ISL-100]
MTIEIRTVGTADVSAISAVSRFFAEVWQTPPANPPYPAEVLQSLVHAGGAVHAAYDATDATDADRLAGATAAVFGPPAERSVYSLVAAAGASDRGTGFALKQAQREWALGRGAHTMRWTFDPLIGRNARFNLVKLGATAPEYEVDFYGPMADGVNDGDESDRLTAVWDLRSPRSYDATAEDRTGAALLRDAPDGGPLAVRTGDRIWCRAPDDFAAMRAKAPDEALRWRRAVREVFTAAFAEGFAATGMSRDGWYQLTPASAGEGAAA